MVGGVASCGVVVGCASASSAWRCRSWSPVVPVVVCAPPPTDPLAASCCWIYCLSSGEMLFAVQPWLEPPPAPIDSTLIDTPQTLAAMLIGICALIGMFALSILSRARDC